MNNTMKTWTFAAVSGLVAGLGCGSATPAASEPPAASAEPASSAAKNGCGAAPGEKHNCGTGKDMKDMKGMKMDDKPAEPPKPQ